MIDMFMNSVTLFFQGKLFKEPGKVFRQTLIGAVTTAILCVVLANIGLTLWIAVLVSAFVGGALQPWLFKDLKYS